MLLFKFLPSQYNGADYQGRRVYNVGRSGGDAPTNQTVTQTNIPDWLRPQTESLLGAATQEYFNTEPTTYTDPETGETKTGYNITGVKPFTPYSTRPEDYVAGMSPLQQQVAFESANMQRPGQYDAASQFAGAAGMGGMETAGQALGYGQAGFGMGQLGAGIGQQAAQGAEQRARIAEQGAYGYGGAGFEAGQMGRESGMRGQDIGIGGGAQYGGMGAGYGAQAAGLAPEAQGYGRAAADIGAMGLRAEALGRDVGEEARRYARQAAGTGQAYEQMATDPRRMQAYMSPYMQNVVNLQKQAAVEDYQQNIMPQLQAQAVRSGAFGGSRDAVQRAMAQRNLAAQLQNIQATGTQKAFEDAQRAQQFGVTTGLQGLQGAQAGLGTTLQGGQLGLSGIGQAIAGQQAGMQGLGQAGQLYGLGIQGAQTGLSGIDRMLAGTSQGMQGADAAMRGAGLGLQGVGQGIAAGQLGLAGADRALAGTAQGLQGAQAGLQGVSGAQAGYGLTGQMGKAMADIGTAQQQADLARMGFQAQQGQAQQALEQSIINQAIQNYAMAQQNPAQQLAAYNALLRGYATPTTTVSQYQAAPSPISQLSGLGLTGAAMYGLAGGGKKKGGKIKEKGDGIDELMIRKTLKKVKA